ncbi:hypothetical protein DVS28_a0119 [Euzebya pacifica]|uniref:Uncharacterized protein n=1 Tax=Euzebya pacifica TaxID=1608957 RepID=A0A346XRI0_9ACTN|nr:hypothetical protein DVS28_a0119 [Euzebya pacifica]
MRGSTQPPRRVSDSGPPVVAASRLRCNTTLRGGGGRSW